MSGASTGKKEHLLKVLVLGDLGAGKTSFIKRYVHQFFSPHYRATIGVDFALKVVNWDANTTIRLQLWDIAGQERFGNMTRVYYKESVGAFIMFDVTRLSTFEAVQMWKDDLDKKVQLPNGKPIPVVLLANKSDLASDGFLGDINQLDDYCRDKKFIAWFETSSMENHGIDEAALCLTAKMVENFDPPLEGAPPLILDSGLSPHESASISDVDPRDEPEKEVPGDREQEATCAEDQEQQDVSDELERPIRDRYTDKLRKSIHDLKQQVLRHETDVQKTRQDLLDSQRVASDLSFKCEEQEAELDKLRRERDEMSECLEAQKVKIEDLHGKMARKEAAIQNLTDSRSTLERRMTRVVEERDGFALQNLEEKANLKEQLDQFVAFQRDLKSFKERVTQQASLLQTQFATKLSESDREKEIMTQEITDLQNELEARKTENSIVKEDFETERKEREKVTSEYEEKLGKWKILEQELNEQVKREKDRQYEGSKKWNVAEQKYQEELKSLKDELKHFNESSEQRELQLTAELEDEIARALKYQANINKHNDQLREERDTMRMEMNRVAEMYDELEHASVPISNFYRVESENEQLREHLRSLQDRPPKEHTFHAVNREDVVIEDLIDSGAWGTVSNGVFRGCKVAIKQPHPGIMHQSTVDRMKREASNMNRLHHPNLVTFLGAVFDDSNLPMIIIELMEASLRATYKRNALTKTQMLSIFKDVAYAIHYLHEFREPLIHRDLTAPNVLLKLLPDNNYLAKVSDFGSANLEKFATTSGEGAIIYSAPESFPPPRDKTRPRPKQTVKMDSYSYGILLCEVVNHELPDDDHLEEMVEAMAGKWGSVHGLAMQCIEHDPVQRPAMGEILNSLRNEVMTY